MTNRTNAQLGPPRKRSLFTRFAKFVSHASGRPATFVGAVLVLVVWAASGPFFRFSDTWQLVINTGTTIITFLMVFLIQNTQNRDSESLQLKLDELIRAIDESDDALLDLEELDDDALTEIRARYLALAAAKRRRGKADSSDRRAPPKPGARHRWGRAHRGRSLRAKASKPREKAKRARDGVR
ncbi:MAG: low affinity iron permease family protein [Polyangiaceae bacterium]